MLKGERKTWGEHEAITRQSKHIYMGKWIWTMMKRGQGTGTWSGWMVRRYPKAWIGCCNVRSFAKLSEVLQRCLKFCKVVRRFAKCVQTIQNGCEDSEMSFGDSEMVAKTPKWVRRFRNKLRRSREAAKMLRKCEIKSENVFGMFGGMFEALLVRYSEFGRHGDPISGYIVVGGQLQHSH